MSPRSRWRWRRPADATGSSTGPKMPPRSPPRHKPAYFACTVPYAKRAIVAPAAGLLIRYRSSTRALGLAFTFRADKTQDAHPASVKAALARRRLELRGCYAWHSGQIANASLVAFVGGRFAVSFGNGRRRQQILMPPTQPQDR